MNQAILEQVIGGFVIGVVGSLVILSPLIFYMFFFKKKAEHDQEISGATGRNFTFSDADEKKLYSLLKEYGFTDCDSDSAFMKRWNEFIATTNKDAFFLLGGNYDVIKTRLILSRGSSKGSHIVLIDTKRRSYITFTGILFTQDIMLVSDGENNGRDPVEVLPFVSIESKGTSFGFDENNDRKDKRSSSERFQDSVSLYSDVALTELDAIFDDEELQAAIIDAFDLGVGSIKIQHEPNGVGMTYSKLDFEEWTPELINGISSALETIVRRLPPAHQVKYTAQIEHSMIWNMGFCAFAALFFLMSADATFAAQPLQPEIYWKIPIPFMILVLGITILTWPKSYVKPGGAAMIVLLSTVLSFGLGYSMEYWFNRYGMPVEVIELEVSSKKRDTASGAKYYVYLEAPEGSSIEPSVEVSRPMYDALNEKHYGEIRMVTGRFGLTFATDIEIKQRPSP